MVRESGEKLFTPKGLEQLCPAKSRLGFESDW
jgi:hypothetical protein